MRRPSAGCTHMARQISQESRGCSQARSDRAKVRSVSDLSTAASASVGRRAGWALHYTHNATETWKYRLYYASQTMYVRTTDTTNQGRVPAIERSRGVMCHEPPCRERIGLTRASERGRERARRTTCVCVCLKNESPEHQNKKSGQHQHPVHSSTLDTQTKTRLLPSFYPFLSRLVAGRSRYVSKE